MEPTGSFRNYTEIAMGSMEAVEEAINENEAFGERAPQKPAGISRNVTADIRKVVRFDSWSDYWNSLPVVSKLFMFMTFIDVLMVVGYVIWQIYEMYDETSCSQENCPKSEEHFHVILGMLVTACFLVAFVIDAIFQENDFELLACLLLTIVIAGRVVYFMFTAHFELWARITATTIVSVAALVTTLLGILTYSRFGWRIYSRLACDLRLKHAAERTVIYFAQNRFGILVKLDFQFLVLVTIIGVVMSVQNSNISVRENDYTIILLACTVLGFLIGLPWLIAAYYATRHEIPDLARFLGLSCIFTLVLPVGAAVSVYVDPDSGMKKAKESLLISTILLLLLRFAVWHYMAKLMSLSVAKHDKSEQSDFRLKVRTSGKNPDLLPLLKGAWLIKKPFNAPNAPNKRRFFQLSQDYTSLRWAWNSHVLLFHVEELDTNDIDQTITLHFSIEPDLVVGFETSSEYETWKQGFTVVLSLLLAPDDILETQSRIRVNKSSHSQRKQSEARDSSNTAFEAFLNRLGVRTRHHTLRSSRHPLKEAEQQLKMKLDSRNNPTNRSGELPESLRVDGINRNSSRIPSRLDVDSRLSNQPSINSASTGNDSGTPSNSSEMMERPGQSLLNSLQMLVESIEYDDLDFGKFLGSGAEGAVWAAWYLDTPVAVKKTNSVHELEMTMHAGQHDNVVGLRGLAKEGSFTYIVLEYCPRGTLDVMLHHTMTSRWDSTKVLQMIRCIARGVLHLHSRKPAILHRDLKPANVFVSHGLVLKIGDFGMSRQLKPMPDRAPPTATRLRRTLTPGVIGTASYCAPELLDERLQSNEYDVDRLLKVDVYSFGVTMWEIVKRERPFEGVPFFEIVAGWSNDSEGMKLDPFNIPKDLPMVDQKILRNLQDLTIECTHMSPDMRPDMKIVVKRLRDLHLEVQNMSGEAHV